MKMKKRGNKRKALTKVEQPSKVRALILRAASLAAGVCLGVGFEELVRWLWVLVRHLF